jgi:hypothetical protein
MSDGLLMLVKIALAVLLLPALWACGVVFHDYIASFPGAYGEFFFWGMFGFLMLFLFFYQFYGVYEFGQKIVTGAFQFMFPFSKVLVCAVPFYLTIILLLYTLVVNALGVKVSDHYFMFFAGFFFSMHLILTAQDLQQQEKSFIKPTYLLMMSVSGIFLACITVLLFNLVFMKFTFPDFLQDFLSEAGSNYTRVVKVLVGK